MFYKQRPPHTLSQNFLKSQSLVKNLVTLSSLNSNDFIFEIGAGSGQITSHLASIISDKGRLLAIEADQYLFHQLSYSIPQKANVKLIHGDIRNFNWHLLPNDYILIANLPFNFTSFILRNALNSERRPCSKACVIIQKEAALLYGGGRLNHFESKKSLCYAPFYNFEILKYLKPSDFIPSPNVNVVYLSITRRSTPLIPTNYHSIWNQYISVITQDRVGQGIWKKLFTKIQLGKIRKNMSYNWGMGVSCQELGNYLAVFNDFVIDNPKIMKIIRHEYSNLDYIHRNQRKAYRTGLN